MGISVQFDVNDKAESTGLTFIQPNGNFKAKRNNSNSKITTCATLFFYY
jgi:hypothetical protein